MKKGKKSSLGKDKIRQKFCFARCGKRKFFETVAKTKRRGEFRWRDWDRATAGLGTACRFARIFWFLKSWKDFFFGFFGIALLFDPVSDKRKHDLVAADAGVFDKTALATSGEVHVEPFVNGITVRRCLDRQDNWKDIAFRQRFI